MMEGTEDELYEQQMGYLERLEERGKQFVPAEPWVVVCSGSGTRVYGPWMDNYQSPNNWLGEFHCIERRFLDGRMARREDWHCDNGSTLADHNIIRLLEPRGHRAQEVP